MKEGSQEEYVDRMWMRSEEGVNLRDDELKELKNSVEQMTLNFQWLDRDEWLYTEEEEALCMRQ